MATVVRVNKVRETMPKLILPANDALDDDELEELRKSMKRVPSLSPSPSPVPPDDIETEIDPDNVVIRGSYTDDEWSLVSTKRNKKKCSFFMSRNTAKQTNQLMPFHCKSTPTVFRKWIQKKTHKHANKQRLCIREWRSSLFLRCCQIHWNWQQTVILFSICFIWLSLWFSTWNSITKQIIYRLENVLLMVFFTFR